MNSAYCRRRSVISPLITLLIHYCCCRRRPLRCEFQTSRSFVVSYASCLSSFAFASGRNSLSSRGKTHHRCLICMYETIEARYTLATKLNSTQSTCWNRQQIGNKVDCCRYGQLCYRYVDFVAGFCNKSATTCIRKFVAVDFVADTVDFVASVYGAKATRSTLSTFNKVDRVEFNFVASVYRA